MKYKIFLDSNQVYNKKGPLNEVLDLSIPNLRKFLKENKVEDVEICLPEIVIKERIQTRMEDIEKELDKANEPRSRLKDIGHKIAKITPRKDYKKMLKQSVDRCIKENNVIRVPDPSISKEELIDRAVNKMRPFNDGGTGFKDTLIFLSIVDDALSKNAVDRYILCTNNFSDFTEDVKKEFKEKTGKDLYILPFIENVKEKLDELIPLNLHLQKRNTEIRNLILSNIGEIIHAVNKTISNPYRSNTVRSTWRATRYDELPLTTWNSITNSSYDANKRAEAIEAYNYDSMTVDNFTEKSEGIYAVSATVNTLIQYRNDISDRGSYDSDYLYQPYRDSGLVYASAVYGGNVDYSRSASKTFFIEVECDFNESKIVLLSVKSGFVI